jgi:micrococcal nuclease
MSKPLTPQKPPRRAAMLLLAALAVLFLFWPPTAGLAFAREETPGTETSELTILRGSASSDRASGGSAGSGAARVGDSEAIAGDAYAGDGCARAGEVAAGDCEGKGSGGHQNGGGSDHSSRPEKGEHGSTDPETTTEEPTTEESAPERTTADSTTLEEATLLEDTAEGETTSTASPAPVEGKQCPTAPPKNAVEARIEGAVDGDTLALAEEVEGYDTVRLIGVDTPELGEASDDGQPEPLAEEASDFTADELEGQKVLIQVGEEEADQYGRLLAYVWTGDATKDGFVGDLGRMVGRGEADLFNRKLLEEGYAEVLTIEPNDLYAGCFEDAEREARDAGIGIWAGAKGAGGPTDDRYEEEETAQQTTAEVSPSHDTGPDTGPVRSAPVEESPAENAPTGQASAEASVDPEGKRSAQETERQRSPVESQYERTTPPTAKRPEPEAQEEEVQDAEIRDEEIQEPEVQEPEVQESVAPSGGDEAAVLETGPSPAASVEASVEASASPDPTGELPARTASTEPVSALPDTGGPSLLALGAGLAAAGLLGIAMLAFLAVRSSLRRPRQAIGGPVRHTPNPTEAGGG